MNHTHPMPPCHVCQHPGLSRIPGYETLWRVSSDCMPIPPGGELAVCTRCAAVQKPITPHWQRMIDDIYRQYQIYHQSGGVEQVVFNPQTGQATGRSATLLRKLASTLMLPPAGRMLDVGCGNGALLAAMGQLHPQWRLTGTELSDQHRAAIQALPGVEAFHAGPAGLAQGTFDLVTLMHVLEHVPQPGDFLRSLAGKLAPASRLLVEVPDHHRNPFDLLIADHSTHFSLPVLRMTLRQAGLSPGLASRDIIPKELTAVGVLDSDAKADDSAPSHDEACQEVTRRIDWLAALAGQSREAARHGPVGIFGTSIAGTWLAATLGEGVGFFVDEDRARIGRQLMGRPVFAPTDPHARQGRVIVALPDWLAAQVAHRLGDVGVDWLLPPTMQ